MTGLHEEVDEDDITTKFSDYGPIKNLHCNMDRQTGFYKGYALVEFESYETAAKALEELNGSEMYGKKMSVHWAFSDGPLKKHK